jgi:hypothetical protein
MVCEQSSVPQISRIAEIPRALSQVAVDSFPLCLAEPARPARAFSLTQGAEAFRFKPLHPTFDGPWILPEEVSDVIAAEAMADEEDSMKPMVIPRFLGSADFLLNRNLHDFSVGDLQFAHIRPSLPTSMAGKGPRNNLIMRHYLCRSV